MKKLLEMLLLSTFVLASPSANYLSAYPEPMRKRDIRDYIPELSPKPINPLEQRIDCELSPEEVKTAVKLLNLEDTKNLVLICSDEDKPYITTRILIKDLEILADVFERIRIVAGEEEYQGAPLTKVAQEIDIDENKIVTEEEYTKFLEELTKEED